MTAATYIAEALDNKHWRRSVARATSVIAPILLLVVIGCGAGSAETPTLSLDETNNREPHTLLINGATYGIDDEDSPTVWEELVQWSQQMWPPSERTMIEWDGVSTLRLDVTATDQDTGCNFFMFDFASLREGEYLAAGTGGDLIEVVEVGGPTFLHIDDCDYAVITANP